MENCGSPRIGGKVFRVTATTVNSPELSVRSTLPRFRSLAIFSTVLAEPTALTATAGSKSLQRDYVPLLHIMKLYLIRHGETVDNVAQV